MVSDRLIEQLFGSFGSSGGGQYGDAAGSIFGSLFGGGRALGGDVRGDRIYRVGERDRPELANIGRHQYLIPGDRGNVEPIRSGRQGAPTVNVFQTFNTEGRIDPRTASQMQLEAGQKIRTATSRNH